MYYTVKQTARDSNCNSNVLSTLKTGTNIQTKQNPKTMSSFYSLTDKFWYGEHYYKRLITKRLSPGEKVMGIFVCVYVCVNKIYKEILKRNFNKFQKCPHYIKT